MAEENGLSAIGPNNIRPDQAQNRNQVQVRREVEREDSNAQARRSEEGTVSRVTAGEDRVDLTREARQQGDAVQPRETKPDTATSQGPQRQQQADRAEAENLAASRNDGAQQQQQAARPDTEAPQGQPRAEAASNNVEQNLGEPRGSRADENPLNRRVQDLGTNQTPRVRNEARQNQPGQNAIGQRREVDQAVRENRPVAGDIKLEQNTAEPRVEANPTPPEPRNQPAQNAAQGGNSQRAATQEAQANRAEQRREREPANRAAPEPPSVNPQKTREDVAQRQERREAAEEPLIETPSVQDATRALQSSEPPPTPNLEGSIAQAAEQAQTVRLEKQARVAEDKVRLKEAEKRLTKEQESPRGRNRDPVAVQTEVGRNVDRLV